MMRANRSTLVKLCLLTALAVPVQRAAMASTQPRSSVYKGEPSPAVEEFLAVATSSDGEQAIADVREVETAAVAQIADPKPTATTADGKLTARTDDENLAVIEDASGTLVAGPLTGAGGAVTALAFSEDGKTLVTGTNTGKVRYWGIDGNPKGEAFQVVIGGDNTITDLEFQGNDKLYAAGSQGRSGFWGLDGLSYGEGTAVAAETGAGASSTASGATSPLWWLLPLLALGAGGLWLLSRRSKTAEVEPKRQTAPTATVPPPVGDPATDREVSNRAQSVISTDRVADECRAIPPSEPITAASLDPLPVGLPGLEPEPTAYESTAYESTDLESPELEGTNFDLSTPAVLGGSALGGIAVGAIGLDAGVESDSDEDEEWDDNLDLTLDDTPIEAIKTIESEPAPAADEPALSLTTANAAMAEPEDFWATGTEPTRDTVIADLADISAPEVALTIEPTRETIIGDRTVIFDGAAASMPLGAVAAGLSAGAVARIALEDSQSDSPDGIKFTEDEPLMSQDDLSSASETEPVIEPAIAPLGMPTFTVEELASVDDGLPDLPDGYGDSRLVLLPRDPKWAYAYWDISNEHKEALRQQGGQQLMLRLYDVTDIDQSSQSPHSVQEYGCHEMARSWYVEIPVSDRDYTAEIGYLTADDHWLLLARSASVRVPPIYPSAWVKDRFVTVDWNQALAEQTVADLGRPDEDARSEVSDRATPEFPPVSEALLALTQEQQAAMGVAGSLFGSMHQLPPGALSDSGMASGQVSSLNLSGLTMSGVGMGSGGFELPERSRKFWLIADAELIVYGATEPDATLTIGDRTVPLSADGTFRFHISFPDGKLDYPIRAIAADGEQSRSVTLNFERDTPERNTNPKADARDEWF